MSQEKPTAYQVFASFLKLGLTAFGGPAMVNHIRMMAVETKKWIDDTTFRDGIALCQTLPGATAVNVASYVGYRILGLPGMIVSFIGFTLPAFLLMLVLSALYSTTRSMPAADSLFNGLEVVVVSIVAHATFSFGKNTLKSARDYLIPLLGAVFLWLKVNPFIVIICAALIGVLVFRSGGIGISPPLKEKSSSLRDSIILAVAYLIGFSALWMTNQRLFDLASVMAKIEVFAFGGGYTALTLMFHEVVEARSWLDNQMLMDGVALGQLTPGPILITATFIGYFVNGISGALVGTISIFAPGLLLITTVLPFYDRLRASALFMRAVRGIICCFVGLLLFVTIKFALHIPWDVRHVLLFGASTTALFYKIDLLYVVGISALLSIVLF